MNPLADVRSFTNRLRPFERLESGRRVIAIVALAQLACRAGDLESWQAIRNLAAHSANPDELASALEHLAHHLESVNPELHGVFTDTLLPDLRNTGAALPGILLIAGSLVERQLEATPAEAAEFLDTALMEVSQGAASGEIVTSPGLARLMVELLEPGDTSTVLDPSCGLGTTLAQVVRRSPKASIFGQEVNALLAALARLRLNLLGADAEIEVGDALAPYSKPFGNQQFDRVVCDPPIGLKMPEKVQQHLAAHYNLQGRTVRSEAVFLLRCLDALQPDGRAVVLMPVSFLFRPSEKEVRTRLLKLGHIEGVISLPTGVVAWTELAFAVIVLRGTADKTLPIVLVNGEHIQIKTRRGAERLTNDKVKILIDSYHQDKDSEVVAHLSISELLERDANLRPQIWMEEEKDHEPDDLGSLYRTAVTAEKDAALLSKELDSLSIMLKLKG